MASGSYHIPAFSQDLTIFYAFGTTPSAIAAVVSNTSPDSVKEQIDVLIVDKESNSFSVHLSAPTPTANYTLDWLASDGGVYGSGGQARPSSTLPVSYGLPAPTAWLTFTDSTLPAQTKRTQFQSLYQSFATYVTTPPTSPVSQGMIGQWSVDDSYLYVFNGVYWGRSPLNTRSWADDPTTQGMLTFSGSTPITSGSSMLVVSFPTPILATPFVTFSIMNKASTTLAMITGVLSAVGVSGFTIRLNSPTPDANYSVVWQASYAPPTSSTIITESDPAIVSLPQIVTTVPASDSDFSMFPAGLPPASGYYLSMSITGLWYYQVGWAKWRHAEGMLSS